MAMTNSPIATGSIAALSAQLQANMEEIDACMRTLDKIQADDDAMAELMAEEEAYMANMAAKHHAEDAAIALWRATEDAERQKLREDELATFNKLMDEELAELERSIDSRMVGDYLDLEALLKRRKEINDAIDAEVKKPQQFTRNPMKTRTPLSTVLNEKPLKRRSMMTTTTTTTELDTAKSHSMGTLGQAGSAGAIFRLDEKVAKLDSNSSCQPTVARSQFTIREDATAPSKEVDSSAQISALIDSVSETEHSESLIALKIAMEQDPSHSEAFPIRLESKEAPEPATKTTAVESPSSFAMMDVALSDVQTSENIHGISRSALDTQTQTHNPAIRAALANQVEDLTPVSDVVRDMETNAAESVLEIDGSAKPDVSTIEPYSQQPTTPVERYHGRDIQNPDAQWISSNPHDFTAQPLSPLTMSAHQASVAQARTNNATAPSPMAEDAGAMREEQTSAIEDDTRDINDMSAMHGGVPIVHKQLQTGPSSSDDQTTVSLDHDDRNNRDIRGDVDFDGVMTSRQHFGSNLMEPLSTTNGVTSADREVAESPSYTQVRSNQNASADVKIDQMQENEEEELPEEVRRQLELMEAANNGPPMIPVMRTALFIPEHECLKGDTRLSAESSEKEVKDDASLKFVAASAHMEQHVFRSPGAAQLPGHIKRRSLVLETTTRTNDTTHRTAESVESQASCRTGRIEQQTPAPGKPSSPTAADPLTLATALPMRRASINNPGAVENDELNPGSPRAHKHVQFLDKPTINEYESVNEAESTSEGDMLKSLEVTSIPDTKTAESSYLTQKITNDRGGLLMFSEVADATEAFPVDPMLQRLEMVSRQNVENWTHAGVPYNKSSIVDPMLERLGLGVEGRNQADGAAKPIDNKVTTEGQRTTDPMLDRLCLKSRQEALHVQRAQADLSGDKQLRRDPMLGRLNMGLQEPRTDVLSGSENPRDDAPLPQPHVEEYSPSKDRLTRTSTELSRVKDRLQQSPQSNLGHEAEQIEVLSPERSVDHAIENFHGIATDTEALVLDDNHDGESDISSLEKDSAQRTVSRSESAIQHSASRGRPNMENRTYTMPSRLPSHAISGEVLYGEFPPSVVSMMPQVMVQSLEVDTDNESIDSVHDYRDPVLLRGEDRYTADNPLLEHRIDSVASHAFSEEESRLQTEQERLSKIDDPFSAAVDTTYDRLSSASNSLHARDGNQTDAATYTESESDMSTKATDSDMEITMPNMPPDERQKAGDSESRSTDTTTGSSYVESETVEAALLPFSRIDAEDTNSVPSQHISAYTPGQNDTPQVLQDADLQTLLQDQVDNHKIGGEKDHKEEDEQDSEQATILSASAGERTTQATDYHRPASQNLLRPDQEQESSLPMSSTAPQDHTSHSSLMHAQPDRISLTDLDEERALFERNAHEVIATTRAEKRFSLDRPSTRSSSITSFMSPQRSLKSRDGEFDDDFVIKNLDQGQEIYLRDVDAHTPGHARGPSTTSLFNTATPRTKSRSGSVSSMDTSDRLYETPDTSMSKMSRRSLFGSIASLASSVRRRGASVGEKTPINTPETTNPVVRLEENARILDEPRQAVPSASTPTPPDRNASRSSFQDSESIMTSPPSALHRPPLETILTDVAFNPHNTCYTPNNTSVELPPSSSDTFPPAPVFNMDARMGSTATSLEDDLSSPEQTRAGIDDLQDYADAGPVATKPKRPMPIAIDSTENSIFDHYRDSPAPEDDSTQFALPDYVAGMPESHRVSFPDRPRSYHGGVDHQMKDSARPLFAVENMKHRLSLQHGARADSSINHHLSYNEPGQHTPRQSTATATTFVPTPSRTNDMNTKPKTRVDDFDPYAPSRYPAPPLKQLHTVPPQPSFIPHSKPSTTGSSNPHKATTDTTVPPPTTSSTTTTDSPEPAALTFSQRRLLFEAEARDFAAGGNRTMKNPAGAGSLNAHGGRSGVLAGNGIHMPLSVPLLPGRVGSVTASGGGGGVRRSASPGPRNPDLDG